MKTRAAVLTQMGLPAPYAQSRPLQIRDVDLDPPGRGEVLVRIHVAGLCHSDLSVIDGSRPRVMPMALGHESAAEVVEVGPGVQDLRAGDQVVTVFVPSCGHCNPCISGRPALCEPGAQANAQGTLLGGERRLHSGGGVLNHHLGVSCFADHAVVSRQSCVRMEEGLTWQEAALFGCAVLTGAGAIINRAAVKPGDTVAIVGLGGVGMSALMAAAAAGARRLVGVEPDPGKRELALELGASHVVDPAQVDSVAGLLDAAGGPVDVGYDAAGAPAAFESAYALTRRGGLTLTTGLPHPQATFALPIAELVAQEREIRGSYLGSGAPAVDIPRYVDLYRAGRLPVDRLIGRSFALDDINAGFDHLASGSGLRHSIVFDA